MHWLCKALCKNGFTNNLHKFVLLVLHDIFWSYARESQSLTNHVFLDEISASVSIFHERRHMISAASLAVSKFTVSSKISSQKKHLVFLRLWSRSVFRPSYFICWNAFMKFGACVIRHVSCFMFHGQKLVVSSLLPGCRVTQRLVFKSIL